MLIRFITALLTGLIAASCMPSGDGGSSGNDESCRYECPPQYRCDDAVVYVHHYRGIDTCVEDPVDGSYCAELSVEGVETCERGCRTDIDNVDVVGAHDLGAQLCAADAD